MMRAVLFLIIWLILSVTVLAAHEPEECECICEKTFETISEPAVFEDVKRGAPATGIPADDDFLKRIQSIKSRLKEIDRIPEPGGKT